MKRLIPLLVVLGALAALPHRASAQDAPGAAATSARPLPPLAAKQAFEVMMDALKDDDYQAFISLGTPEFQQAISKTLFETVAAQLGPRAREGFTATFLDSLKKRALTVYVWKVEFKSGDDGLAQMSMNNGKVAGFFIG